MKRVEPVIRDGYEVFAESLHGAYDWVNSHLPIGFKVGWFEVVQSLEWACTMHEKVKLLTPFANCYFLFEFESDGRVLVAVFWNGKEKYNTVVAKTTVGIFLDAVDGL